jgi:8-oxo-dGTP diphosphatase
VKGWKQAEALADLLTGVERVLSSPYLRCRQTLEPLAARIGVAIADDPRLAEGTPIAEALALITAAGPPAAMCTHGDLVVGLVDHLIERRLVTPTETGGSKASTWKLEIEKGEITSAQYLPPPR